MSVLLRVRSRQTSWADCLLLNLFKLATWWWFGLLWRRSLHLFLRHLQHSSLVILTLTSWGDLPKLLLVQVIISPTFRHFLSVAQYLSPTGRSQVHAATYPRGNFMVHAWLKLHTSPSLRNLWWLLWVQIVVSLVQDWSTWIISVTRMSKSWDGLNKFYAVLSFIISWRHTENDLRCGCA